jgi:glucose/mannose-6-phosphate isomerase
MIEIIKKYPEMITDAIKRAERIDTPDYKFNNIVVTGMGASAIGGELLKSLLRDKIKIPIEVSRDYHPPAYVDKNTLVFCISYSGNSEETLSQFVDAFEKKCKIIAITSGGKLRKWCDKLKIPYFLVPSGYQSRSALPYLFVPMIVFLQKFGIINLRDEIDETIKILKEIKTYDLKEIVSTLSDSVPIIYASNEYSPIAERMKTQFNENSKMLARFAIFPELSHNEVVGYQNDNLNNNSLVIFLRDKNETEELGVRIDITKDIIKDKVKGIHEIWAYGSNRLSKMMSLAFIGDVLSYELAVSRGVDPFSVENIDIIKKGLEESLNFAQKLEKKLGIS